MRQHLSAIANAYAFILLVAALLLGVSGSAYAFLQSPTPSSTPTSTQEIAADRRAEIARYAAALQSGDEEERRQAVLMLGAMRDAATIPTLRAALGDKAERVRAAAIAALGMLDDSSLTPVIAIYLTKDNRPFVRKTAAYALGHFATGDATAALIVGLRDKDMEVRGAAAVALSSRPDAAAIAPLIKSLSDKSPFVRAHAAAALGVNGRAAAQAVPDLVRVLAKDEDHESRRQAATALGRIGEPSSLTALQEAERSSDPYLSQAAREAISSIREQ
ncbi:MAG: HEAT repeat domain-containing protein [Blastocatellia bacterium]